MVENNLIMNYFINIKFKIENYLMDINTDMNNYRIIKDKIDHKIKENNLLKKDSYKYKTSN